MSAALQRECDFQNKIVRSTAENCQLLLVHWELTYRCNCRCTHCYVVKPGDAGFASPGPELSTDEAKCVLDQLAEENVLNLAFSGGEILCRSDFFEIADYAHWKRFAMRLFTNGTLIRPREADLIAELYPVRVEMSVYSHEACVHDAITQVPGSFAKVINSFRLLQERGVTTRMKTPLMRENVRQIDQLQALAKTLGAEFRYDITIVPKDNGARTPLRHRLSDDDLIWLYDHQLDGTWQPRKLAPGSHVCTSGRNQAVIDPYGRLRPCVQIPFNAGSVREQRLGDIWRTSSALKRMRSLTFAHYKECVSCDVREYCNLCPGVALVEDGDLLGPSEVACREARLLYQVMQKKKREEMYHGDQR